MGEIKVIIGISCRGCAETLGLERGRGEARGRREEGAWGKLQEVWGKALQRGLQRRGDGGRGGAEAWVCDEGKQECKKGGRREWAWRGNQLFLKRRERRCCMAVAEKLHRRSTGEEEWVKEGE